MSRDWVTLAACRGTDVDLWDSPVRGSESFDLQAALARIAVTICGGCPVIADCAADAREHPPVGVIRAGVPHDGQGAPAGNCGQCGQVIVTFGFAYCSTECQSKAAYRRQVQREKVAA